jgi:hypothetical protein
MRGDAVMMDTDLRISERKRIAHWNALQNEIGKNTRLRSLLEVALTSACTGFFLPTDWVQEAAKETGRVIGNQFEPKRKHLNDKVDNLVSAIEKAERIIAFNATNRMHHSRDGRDPELEALHFLRAALALATGEGVKS